MSNLARLEALLFVAGEDGLSLQDLAGLSDMAPTAVLQQLEKLAEQYRTNQDSALNLLETSKRYKLVTKDSYADLLRQYSRTPINQSLSRASLEVLSIIAYKQPITRIEVDDIRGVNSSGSISKLQAFDLIREDGKKEVLGRPNLYVTTDYFLDFMGINSLEDLPDASSIELKDEEMTLFQEKEALDEEVEKTAKLIMELFETSTKESIHVAYGTLVNEIREVSRSYKEAKMALDVGKIFFNERDVIAYSELGIGRLIYQLPIPLCKMFIKEIFDGRSPDEFDEETLTTINKFFENSLNVSETSRQLYIHRNTLVYRLDKLQKSTGLDLRIFEDAITFKIALMVVKYMKYMENFEY